jgi:Na+:H+ antiporter
MILAWAMGTPISAGGAVTRFAVMVGGGALVGVVIGMAVAEVMRRIDDAMIEITLTTIAAYGSFVAAEQFQLSGVIATVAAGMLCGNYAATRGMSPSTRISVESFWEYLAFALNSIVFLLIGFEVELSALWAAWMPILVAYLAVTVGRSVVVGGVSAGLAATRRGIPTGWSVVLGWGGLRGGISMVLALSLPSTFPHRDLIITMTFGVVILIILLHGLTMSPLLRRLGLTSASEARRGYEAARGEMQTANGALAELRAMRGGRFTDPTLLDGLEAEYESRVRGAQKRLEAMHLEHRDLRWEEEARARRRVLHAEKDQVLAAYRSGLMGAEVHEQLLRDIDLRLERLDDGPGPGEPGPGESA